MTVKILTPTRVAGEIVPTAAVRTLDAAMEAALITRGDAVDARVLDGTTGGIDTVLFGDSMTDTYETIASGLTGAYDVDTGLLTLTVTGHQQAVGWYAAVWNRATTSARAHRRVPVVSVTDANTLVVQMPKGMTDVPASSAVWFFRPESWRSAQAFVTWLQAVSGQRFNILYNGAQSGDTTANALARIDRDCLAYNPAVVIMQTTGINDTSVGNGNLAEDVIVARQCEIVDRICAWPSVQKLVLLNLTPVASGESRGTKTNMSRVRRMNDRLRDYATRKPQVLFHDVHSLVVDPTSVNGLALANFLRTSDTIHYSMRGGRAVAEMVWTQSGAQFPSVASSLPTSALDNYSAAALTLTSPVRTAHVVQATVTAHGLQHGEYMKVFGGSSEVMN